MSRIGKKPIVLPQGVSVAISDETLSVKGPKGSLSLKLHPAVTARVEDQEGQKVVLVEVNDPEEKSTRALWGLFRSLINNLVLGVTVGFSEKLEINGVGYKAQVSGKKLVMELGFSHEVVFEAPEGIAITVEKNLITISGIDKQLVGETAARIRKFRKPEPYQGKGIKYLDEVIKLKAGKAASKAAA
ncbi:MAG: 50S ribosomal protein L6 [bacterium]